MKILMCTGIYPPQVGGPAQYAKEVAEQFRREGHEVRVLAYGRLERALPPLIRHELFFYKILRNLRDIDFVVALDTFSVGWPAVAAAKIFGKKIVIRTGGDFLWESYVERTGDKVLLRNFYATRKNRLNLKERFIFKVTTWTLRHASAVIFSTAWQRDMFAPVYGLDPAKIFIVENFYGQKAAPKSIEKNSAGDISAVGKKIFVAGTRPLVWKNLNRLAEAFAIAQKQRDELVLDTQPAPYAAFFEKIKNSYAVVLASLGDISPNMILDAIRANTPFILTRENGLTERIKDIAIFCDPEHPHDIAEKILWLADETNYAAQKQKIASFSFVHSWKEIADEIMKIARAAK